MRLRLVPLTMLTVTLIGCTDDMPTALSAGDAAAVHAAVAPELPFHGTLATTHTSVFDPNTYTAQIHLVGNGHATYLGKYTSVTDIVIDGATLAGAGQTTWTAANGDVLTTTGTVQGMPSSDGTLSAVTTETITGGTGRFAGATGSFITRQVNLAPGVVSDGSVEGTVRFANPTP